MMVAGCRREGPSDVASPGFPALPVLAAGGVHSLAVAADGTVWNRSTSVQVQGQPDMGPQG